MASSSSIRLLVGAVVVAVLAAMAAAARSPDYCEAVGQAFARSQRSPHCRWYVTTRGRCGVFAVPYLPVSFMKDMCCEELGQIPAECRCKALRVLMEDTRLQSSPAAADERCWAKLGDMAASLVTEAECGLSTVHGRPYCDTLAAEE